MGGVDTYRKACDEVVERDYLGFELGGPDGSSCNDGVIRLWDTATWQQVHEMRGHTSYVKVVAFSPDGTQLASGSGDFTVRLWDTLTRAERRQAASRAERSDP